MKPFAFAAVEIGALAVASIGLAFSEVTVPENVAVGGVTAIIVVIGGNLVSWYLRVKADRDKSKADRVEVDQAAEDRQAARQRKIDRDAWTELQQVVADLRSDRELDREELHKVRADAQVEKTEHAVTKVRLDQCEKDRAELFRRVEALENR